MVSNPTALRPQLLFGGTCGLGLGVILWSLATSPLPLAPVALLFMTAGACTGLMRPRLPGIGTIGLALPYVLATLLLFGLGAATLIGALAALLSSLPIGRDESQLDFQRAAYHMGSQAIKVFIAGAVCLTLMSQQGVAPGTLSVIPLLGFAAAFLIVEMIRNGLSRAAGAHTRSPRPVRYFLIRGLAGTLAGTALTPLIVASYHHPVARPVVLSGPLVYLLCWLVGVLVKRGKARRERSRNVNVLQRDLTHALAAASNAGCQEAATQLKRSQTLCLAVSDRLALPEAYREALSTAVLVHKVGSVASDQPQPPQPVATEAIRRQPVHGAELLRGIGFPPQVVAIVRHHRERWDGCGYPNRIEGRDIPTGSRILSVVNTYLLLISGSMKRKPLSLWEARAHLRSESGRAHDPAVVAALIEVLEEEGSFAHHPAVEDDMESVSPLASRQEQACVRLPLAQRHLQTLYDLARTATYPIEFEECLNLFSIRLDELVPYRSLVLYLLDEQHAELQARFTRGQGSKALGRLTLPVGERVSGRAALFRQAIIEEHLAIDEGPCGSDLDELHDDMGVVGLCATLAAPLIADGQVLGTLTLYDGRDRSFSSEDHSHLVDAAGHLARTVQRQRQRGEIGSASLTDRLTGLPNTRLLRHEISGRINSSRPHDPASFGMLAFKVRNLTDVGERFGVTHTERLLCRMARWLAVSCHQGETLTRMGQDLFVIVTPIHQPGDLIQRAAALTGEVPSETLDLPAGARNTIRLEAAHATYPEDGDTVDELFGTLDERLSLAVDRRHTVLPFRRAKMNARAS